MANSLYMAWKQVQWGDNAVAGFSVPDLEGGSQKAYLVDSAFYTPLVNADQSLNDISGSGRVANVALSGGTVVGSAGTVTWDVSDFVFPTVTGATSEYIVLDNDTGTATTSLLLVFFDTFTSGMPVTPNGGDIDVTVNASGIAAW